MDDAKKVAHYVLGQLHQRFPGQWLGARRQGPPSPSGGTDSSCLQIPQVELSPRQQQRLKGVASLNQLFDHFLLRMIPGDSHMGMSGWLEGHYPLILRKDIPTPKEMLQIQCQGQRYVTLLLAQEAQNQPIGRHSGAFEFLLHDLEHAHKFFGDGETHQGQVRFFRLLHQALEAKVFDDLLNDQKFVTEMHYLMADMNSHPLHLLKYLKAIVLNVHLRKHRCTNIDLSDFWSRLFSLWRMDANTVESALKVNCPGLENMASHRSVTAFFTLETAQ